MDEPEPGVVRASGTIAAGGGPTVRSFFVDDAAAFGRTAFVEALERAGVRIDARATGTRAGTAPGAPATLLGARGLSGYLTGAGGRELYVTVMLANAPIAEIADILAIIEDQVRIVETIHLAT